MLLWAGSAQAQEICFSDLWGVELEAGVDWCTESVTPSGSSSAVAVHWTIIDLSEPSLAVRVTREGEGGRTTTSVAALLGSTVSINGDWHDTATGQPTGLSVGSGWHWSDTTDHDVDSSSVGDWSFLACTTEKDCRFDPMDNLEAWRWRDINMVGGNGQRLAVDGVLHSPSYDSNHRARSGICLDASGNTMTLWATEGGCPGCGYGFTPSQFAEFVFARGCWDGLMLDGGGSTSIVIDGVRRGSYSDAERSVANHLSIIHNDVADPECESIWNGRYCSGTTLHTCQAGLHSEEDYSVFGFSCEEGHGTAYVLDPRCSHGADEDVCLDDSVMGRCEYGQLFEFDCGDFFGAYCEDTDSSARCTLSACTEGGDATWCDGDTLVSCYPEVGDEDLELGLYSSTDCASAGGRPLAQ